MAQIQPSLRMNSGENLDGRLTYERSSSATRINITGTVETVAAGVIRYDYHSDPTLVGGHRGYLLEEASTNLCLQSEDFSTTWVNTAATQTNIGSVTGNTTNWLAPDGTYNSDILSAGSSATGIVAARQTGFTFTDAQKYTVSVWAYKPAANGYDYLEISNLDGTGAGMTFAKSFNLSTGEVGTASGGTVFASGMDAFAGGWYRCWVTFTGSSSTGEIYFKARNDDAVSTETAHTSGDSIYIWGAQIEALQYKTSYIPTTTATVVRAADICSISDTDDMWNWNNGVSLWVDYSPLSVAVATPVFHYSDANNTNYATLLSDGKLKVTTNSAGQLGSDPFDAGMGSVRGTQYRACISMQTNDLHYASNGVLSPNLPDATVDVPLKSAASNYSITFFHGTGFTSGSGWLKGFRIFPQRLSNNDLQNQTVEISTEVSAVQISTLGVVQDNTISEAKLMTGAVSTTKIASEAVVEGKIGDGAVTNGKIGNGAVDGNKIANDAVDSQHLADNSVGTEHLKLDIIVAEDIANNAITIAELADNAVGEAKILNGSVTINKIGADAVDGTKIADDSVDSEHLAAGGIDAEHIADNAVDSQHYAAGSIDNEHMAANSVDSDNYVDLSIDTAHIGNSQVTTDKIAALNVTNALLGADAVDSDKIADNAVRTEHILNSHVTNSKIADDAVDGNKIADNSITAAHIATGTVIEQDVADNAITADKLADDAVDTDAIQDGAVTNDKLGANSITSDKIALDIIVAEDLANNSVTFAEIQDGAVRLAKIQDGAVDGTKIELTGNVVGDIMYYDGGDWVVLHPASGSYLQSNGAGAAPSWASSATLAIALS